MRLLSSSHLVFAAALTVLTTLNDAQVSLKTQSQSSFICDKEQILICEIDSYANTMTWTKDTFASPLASCSPFGCSVNPSMSASYNFTFDTGNGTFYMEILKVKVADNGTTYSCDNGFESDTVTSNVAVENNCSIVKDSMTIDSDTTKVSATTGCIRNNTLEGVQFEWLYHEVNGSETKKVQSTPERNYENLVCLSDPDCGVSGYSSVTNSINIKNDENGKNFTLSVSVTCGGSIIKTVYDDLIFTLNFKEPAASCVYEYGDYEYGEVISIAYGTIIGVVILMCFYEVYQYYSYLKRKYKLFLSKIHRDAEMKQGRLKDEHSRLQKKCLEDLKTPHLEDKCVSLVKKFTKDMLSLGLEEDRRFRLVLQIESDLKSSSLKQDKRTRLESQLKANLKAISLEDEISRLEKRVLADLIELHLEVERFCLVKKLATDLKELHLEENRCRLKEPSVCAIFGITLLCSFPIIGLVVKGVLVYNRRKSVHRQCLLVSLVLCLAFSLVFEIGMTILCAVCCVCQWYALILLFPVLILRYILCINMIDVLYCGDYHKDMPTPSTCEIALSCIPIIGLIYSCLQARNRRVSHKQDGCMGRTSQNANCDRETIQNEIPNLQEPRSRLPKIESISKLQAIKAVMKQHSRLPHIGLSERTRLESKSTKL